MKGIIGRNGGRIYHTEEQGSYAKIRMKNGGDMRRFCTLEKAESSVEVRLVAKISMTKRTAWDFLSHLMRAFVRSQLAIIVFALGLSSSLFVNAHASESYGAAPSNIKEYLDRLVLAYPNTIDRHDGKFLFMKNGARFLISDNKNNKTFDELLAKPDIDDMFYVPYPASTEPAQSARNYDPGRVRFEPLFVAMYGDCTKHEVKNLRTIKWLPKHVGGSVIITRVNGVDKALEEVSRELDQLPNHLIKYLKPSAGTYNCRAIAGTNNKSMHAYGVAIDISSKYSNYWRWSLASKGEAIWRNQIPIQIVRIFERHGFIWGGYWYHYDTMHFEYRPELLP